ncbi:MAG: hypothetical protein JW854_04990 [Actinobacteria bacterium]|nr:hypothetical protein [Actinomycetota bacterium]
MGKKKTFKVDMSELITAMNDSNYDTEYYLDMETGEVIAIFEDCEYMEEYAEILEAIENESERYMYIDKVESRDAYRDMEEFISTEEDEQLKKLLLVAIDGKGAFPRFRNVIWEYPEATDRWFALKNDKDRQRALRFLDIIGVEPAG